MRLIFRKIQYFKQYSTQKFKFWKNWLNLKLESTLAQILNLIYCFRFQMFSSHDIKPDAVWFERRLLTHYLFCMDILPHSCLLENHSFNHKTEMTCDCGSFWCRRAGRRARWLPQPGSCCHEGWWPDIWLPRAAHSTPSDRSTPLSVYCSLSDRTAWWEQHRHRAENCMRTLGRKAPFLWLMRWHYV